MKNPEFSFRQKSVIHSSSLHCRQQASRDCANAQNIMTSSKDDSSENSNTYFDSKYAMKRSIQVVEPEQEVGMHE
jgi:hypothetical protein